MIKSILICALVIALMVACFILRINYLNSEVEEYEARIEELDKQIKVNERATKMYTEVHELVKDVEVQHDEVREDVVELTTTNNVVRDWCATELPIELQCLLNGAGTEGSSSTTTIHD